MIQEIREGMSAKRVADIIQSNFNYILTLLDGLNTRVCKIEQTGGGGSSEIIEQLQTTVNELTEQVTQLNNTVNGSSSTSINSQITNIKSDINDVNSSITNINSEISTLKQDNSTNKLDITNLKSDMSKTYKVSNNNPSSISNPRIWIGTESEDPGAGRDNDTIYMFKEQ